VPGKACPLNILNPGTYQNTLSEIFQRGSNPFVDNYWKTFPPSALIPFWEVLSLSL